MCFFQSPQCNSCLATISETVLAYHAYFASHQHRCFLSVTVGIVVLLPQGIAGKVSLPESTHTNLADRLALGMLYVADKWGHRGSCLHSCLIVLEALICQGSAGNQVGIYSALLCLFHFLQHFDVFCSIVFPLLLKKML